MRNLLVVCLVAAFVGAACTTTGPGASPAGSAAGAGGSITFADTAGGANFQKFFGSILPQASKDLGIEIKYVPGAGAELQTRLE
nr:hypothetical protein [Chloroflexota bacterium]